MSCYLPNMVIVNVLYSDVQHQKDGLIITDRSTNGTNTNTNGSSKS